jgi:hypothetical protein
VLASKQLHSASSPDGSTSLDLITARLAAKMNP